MNVMAKAHKETKALIAAMSQEGQAQIKAERLYGRMFAINLKLAHKEFKVMMNQAQEKESVTSQLQGVIAQMQSIIDGYKAADSKGWVQVFPKSMLLVNAEVGKIASLQNVPRYDHIEDCRFYDGRAQNGSGEKCRTMAVSLYIKTQIEFMQSQLDELTK